jgi:peptidoglycan/LPS O-acetylase OafA/YrhL
LLSTYRRSAIADEVIRAATFTSNVLFASRATDYFRFNDVPSPVLHYWSLSIEEQFYLGLPIFLLLFSVCLPRWRLQAASSFIGVILLISLAFCVHGSQVDPATAFFQTQSRLWQLALGGLVGIAFDRLQLVSSTGRTCLAYAGSLGLASAFVTFSNDMNYPGTWALLPTISSAAILIGAPSAKHLVKALSIPSAIAIGDRSYSLYLWHWPIIAIAAERWPDNKTAQFVAIPVFIAAAWVSFRFIEHPLHKSETFAWARIPIAVAGILTVCTAALALVSYPLSQTSSARAEAVKSASSDFSGAYRNNCHLKFDETRIADCVYGDPNGKRTVVLFGDSHAAQWFDAVERAATEAGWRMMSMTKTSCPSVDISIRPPDLKKYYEACDVWRKNVLKAFTDHSPDLVVLANYSHYYGWLYDNTSGNVVSNSASPKAWHAAYQMMFKDLRAIGTNVLVIRDNPRMLKSYKDCLSTRNDCGRNRSDAIRGMGLPPIDDSYVHLLDFTDQLCSETRCPAMKDGRIAYLDDHHLTATVTRTFWRNFMERLIATDATR